MHCILTSSLKSVACIKVAVQLWMHLDIRQEMLSVDHNTRQKWKYLIKTVRERVDQLMLPEQQTHELKGIVRPIGHQLMRWFMFHKSFFYTASRSATNFFDYLIWTPQGIIDKRRTAERLVGMEDLLTLRERYTLACVYCLEDFVSTLWIELGDEQVRRERRDKIRGMFALQKFWSHVSQGRGDQTLEGISCKEYAFHEAVKSGNDVAVMYFWQLLKVELDSNSRKGLLRNALDEVESKVSSSLHHPKYFAFTPEYYDDVICFLISFIIEERDTDVLKEKFDYLTYFLSLPWQGLFVEIAGYLWSTLPPMQYSFLLLKIVDKMVTEGDYDYQSLFAEFWRQSPILHRKHILNAKSGRYLLSKLFAIKELSYKDRENIEMILDDATAEEKVKIVHDDNCIFALMEMGRLQLLEMLIKKCFPSEDRIKRFKKELPFTEPGKNACVILMRNNKCDVVEAFLRWCCLPEEDIANLKCNLIL